MFPLRPTSAGKNLRNNQEAHTVSFSRRNPRLEGVCGRRLGNAAVDGMLDESHIHDRFIAAEKRSCVVFTLITIFGCLREFF